MTIVAAFKSPSKHDAVGYQKFGIYIRKATSSNSNIMRKAGLRSDFKVSADMLKILIPELPVLPLRP